MIWFAITGLLLVGEMFSGTFYMLALSLGTLAAGAMAVGGSPLEHQLGVGVALSLLGVFILWLARRDPVAAEDEIQNPDVGQLVEVIAVDPLRVHYRGADWEAETADRAASVSLGSRWRIAGHRGNRLIIQP